MPHDPNAHLDHIVLDQIDHSPIGAVPATPTYQDALTRLKAAHQVYASADHKGGYVTARSLAQLPVFHANNLDALVAGKIDAGALETNASIFSRYVLSLPAAHRARTESMRTLVAGKPAHHRAKHIGDTTVVAHDPIHTLFLVPGTGPHPGLPGNYLHGSALQLTADARSAWAVHIHDSDDGAALCDLPTMAAALEKLQEVLASAPFKLDELEALGFRLN
ncbi:MAG: hypothetical protein EXS37_05330 [Opitutus sp.]|nr:hypothetical protein [Opitutus sp.]